MNPNAVNPFHQPEAEFQGELQEFSGPLWLRTTQALNRASAKVGRRT